MFWILLFLLLYMTMILSDKFNKINQRRVVLFLLIVLCIISGTRDYIQYSWDERVYKFIFDTVPMIGDFDLKSINSMFEAGGYEVGYLLVNSIIKSIGISYYGFIFFNVVFFYTCMYHGLKKYINDYYLFLFTFIYKLFVYNTLISMRQSITIAIFFIAIKYIQEKKFVRYFLCCMVALSFHNAALVLFPLYFINRIKLTKKVFIITNIIFIPTLIFRFIDIPVITVLGGIFNKIPMLSNSYKVNNLLNSTGVSEINMMHTVEYFCIMFLIYKLFDKIIDFDDNSEFIIKLFMVLIIVFTMFSGYETMTRIKDYLTFTYAIVLGYICSVKDYRWKYIVKYLWIILCTVGFFKLVLQFGGGFFYNYSSNILKGIKYFLEFSVY